MKIVFNVFVPCLIVDKIFTSELVRKPSVVGACLALGFGITVLSLAISYLGARAIGLPKGGGMRTLTLSASVQNYGYVAIPVIFAIFPSRSSEILGLTFVHNLGIEICIWTIGLMILTGKILTSPKILLNGPILSVVGGLLAVQFGIDRYMPRAGSVDGFQFGSSVRTVITWFAECAFPVALLLIGAMISDLLGKEKLSVRVVIVSILLRLVILPLMILSLAKYLPINHELKQMLVVQAAMPSALLPIMVARLYGGHPQTAVQVVLATTLGALVTMPLLLKWGLQWIG